MAIKFLGGTTAQNDAYTGPARSLTIDVEAGNIRLHDGQTPGGWVIGNLDDLPVTSVNGKEGDVTLTASDVGAYPDNNPDSYVDAAGARQAVSTEGYLKDVSWSEVNNKPSTFPRRTIRIQSQTLADYQMHCLIKHHWTALPLRAP